MKGSGDRKWDMEGNTQKTCRAQEKVVDEGSTLVQQKGNHPLWACQQKMKLLVTFVARSTGERLEIGWVDWDLRGWVD